MYVPRSPNSQIPETPGSSVQHKDEFTRKDQLEETAHYLDGENPLMGDEGGAGISAGGSTNASAGRYHDSSARRH